MDVPPDHVVPDLHAEEREAAIRELLRHLVTVGAIPGQAEASMFRAFCRRERTMTTGVGFGVAVPHIFSDVVTERVVAVNRSSTGVKFCFHRWPTCHDGHPHDFAPARSEMIV